MVFCLTCFVSFGFREVCGVSADVFNFEKGNGTSVDTFLANECFVVFIDVDDTNVGVDVDVNVIGICKLSKLLIRLCLVSYTDWWMPCLFYIRFIALSYKDFGKSEVLKVYVSGAATERLSDHKLCVLLLLWKILLIKNKWKNTHNIYHQQT